MNWPISKETFTKVWHQHFIHLTHTDILKVLAAQLCLTLQPHGLQPTRLFCPWNSPGKNIGWVTIFFSTDLPDPRIEPGSAALQVDSLL